MNSSISPRENLDTIAINERKNEIQRRLLFCEDRVNESNLYQISGSIMDQNHWISIRWLLNNVLSKKIRNAWKKLTYINRMNGDTILSFDSNILSLSRWKRLHLKNMDVHGQEKIEIAIHGSGDRDATAEEIESFLKDAEVYIDNLSADLGLHYAINKRVDRILREKDK